MKLYLNAKEIIDSAIKAVQPDAAVKRALEKLPEFHGRLVLIAAGKAAWQMAKAACDALGNRINSGVVVTKYGHVRGALPGLIMFEAGHPVPDENSFSGTQAALDAVSGLNENDLVLFLLSGGGSALFEKPLVSGEELADITRQLLACGADIVEMNTIRKRLSAVKGGKFAQLCAPAKVFTVVLSDILNDPLDMIASGPAYPDSSTCEQALQIAAKYDLRLSEKALILLRSETPKTLNNVETQISGSVRELCAAAAKKCEELSYKPFILTAGLNCEARDAGSFLASVAQTHAADGIPTAYIAGGETVVHLRGRGKGGRNQELALSAAKGLDGIENVLLFSVGSDGTDGPTDAAGGYVTGTTAAVLRRNGIDIDAVLAENDAYHALAACKSDISFTNENPSAANGGLIFTGPTGTNVNDVAVLLIA